MSDIAEGKLESVAQLMMELGIPKNSAKSLAFIALSRDKVKTVEIETKTGLRQPEVSIAIKHLRRLGWLAKDEMKKEAKGRPVHVYTLSMPMEKLLLEFEKMQRKKINNLEESLNRLKKEMGN